VDHVPLAGLDDAALLGHVDQLAQLDLAGERAVAVAAAGRDRVADQDQQRGQRAEHPAEQPDQRGTGQRDAVGVLPAQRARPDPDQHVADHGHHPRRGDHPEGDAVEGVEHDDRDQPRRGHLAGDPEQQEQGHVPRPVLDHPDERRRALDAVAAHLVHPRLGQPLQRSVQRGEDTAEQDQADGDHEEDHRCGAHRFPDSSADGALPVGSPVTGSRGVERQPSSSFCCRPNISFSSSGSMWS
jgi:hypothetical protein